MPEAPGSIPPALHKPGTWYTLVIPALGRRKDREIQPGATGTQEMPSLKRNAGEGGEGEGGKGNQKSNP